MAVESRHPCLVPDLVLCVFLHLGWCWLSLWHKAFIMLRHVLSNLFMTCFACMWICALHEYSAGRGQKRALNPLKVEFMTVNQVLNIKPESSAKVMSNLRWTISAVTKPPHDFYYKEMSDFAKGLSYIDHVISIFAFIYVVNYIYSFPYVSLEWSNVTMINIF